MKSHRIVEGLKGGSVEAWRRGRAVCYVLRPPRRINVPCYRRGGDVIRLRQGYGATRNNSRAGTLRIQGNHAIHKICSVNTVYENNESYVNSKNYTHFHFEYFQKHHDGRPPSLRFRLRYASTRRNGATRSPLPNRRSFKDPAAQKGAAPLRGLYRSARMCSLVFSYVRICSLMFAYVRLCSRCGRKFATESIPGFVD
jgi:hypothetical protein